MDEKHDEIVMVHRDSLSCEAIVRRLKDGSLFLVCQCGGVKEPAIENRVLVFRSNDGKKWSEGEPIVPENGMANYATDVDVDENGVITVSMTEHSGGYLDTKGFSLISRDNGQSWVRQPLPVFGEKFCFLRNSFRAKNGVKYTAYQFYDIPKEENDNLSAAGKCVFDTSLQYVRCGLISTRDTINYRKSEDILVANEWEGKRIWQWPEPAPIQLSDGSFSMLLRINGAGWLYRCDSADGAVWSAPYATDIPNPNNKPKLLPLKDGSIALINTPNSATGMKYRNPLEIWISDDDMKTWKYKKRVLDFPGWLSYPDGFAEGDKIMFSFEVNRHDVYFASVDISDYFREQKR